MRYKTSFYIRPNSGKIQGNKLTRYSLPNSTRVTYIEENTHETTTRFIS